MTAMDHLDRSYASAISGHPRSRRAYLREKQYSSSDGEVDVVSDHFDGTGAARGCDDVSCGDQKSRRTPETRRDVDPSYRGNATECLFLR